MSAPLASIERLVLLGCGKMGGAMLEGWLNLGLAPAAVAALDPSPPPDVQALLDTRGIAVNPPVSGPADVIIVAVKPQMMAGALPSLKPWVGTQTLIVSVAAGKTIASFEDVFGTGTAIVRTIPNTPAAVGRGMTVGVANAACGSAERARAEALLSAVGQFAWIEDERLMDAVTAVSGSGPAYVFHLVEALAQAGIAQGLPDDLARRIARVTVEGAGELLRQATVEPAVLRQNVTSPGGTTAAALAILMDPDRGFPALLTEAVAAATQRGRELGQ